METAIRTRRGRSEPTLLRDLLPSKDFFHGQKLFPCLGPLSFYMKG